MKPTLWTHCTHCYLLTFIFPGFYKLFCYDESSTEELWLPLIISEGMSGQSLTWKLWLLEGMKREGMLFFSKVRNRSQTINFTQEKLFVSDTIPGKGNAKPERARGSFTYIIDLMHSYEKVSFNKNLLAGSFTLFWRNLEKDPLALFIRKHFVPKKKANQFLPIEISFAKTIQSWLVILAQRR